MAKSIIRKIAEIWVKDTGSRKAADGAQDMATIADGDPVEFVDLIVEAGSADPSAMPSPEAMDELVSLASPEVPIAEQQPEQN